MSLDRSKLFSVEEKTAVLTGASGFLGRTIASVLLENGARVIALGRSESLDELVAEWRSDHGEEQVRGYRVDMYDLDALDRTLREIVANEPVVEILVNNAHELGPGTGFNTPAGSLEQMLPDQLLRNFTGAVVWSALSTQRLGVQMKAQGRGSIINIATMYAQVAPDPALYEETEFLNPPGYSAAKAGLVAFTRYVASFWGRHGVRANALLPGPFSNVVAGGPNSVNSDDPFLGRLQKRTALGRIGVPTELAGALLFLASDASSYVTGQAIVIDGGWTIT